MKRLIIGGLRPPLPLDGGASRHVIRAKCAATFHFFFWRSVVGLSGFVMPEEATRVLSRKSSGGEYTLLLEGKSGEKIICRKRSSIFRKNNFVSSRIKISSGCENETTGPSKRDCVNVSFPDGPTFCRSANAFVIRTHSFRIPFLIISAVLLGFHDSS